MTCRWNDPRYSMVDFPAYLLGKQGAEVQCFFPEIIDWSFLFRNTTFQTEIGDTGKLPMQILPFRTGLLTGLSPLQLIIRAVLKIRHGI